MLWGWLDLEEQRSLFKSEWLCPWAMWLCIGPLGEEGVSSAQGGGIAGASTCLSQNENLEVGIKKWVFTLAGPASVGFSLLFTAFFFLSFSISC